MKKNKAKVLILDIETAPLLGYCWGLWENNIALNQIKSDWHLLSWSAKWLDDPPSKIMYADQSKSKDIENDKDLLLGIWELLDQCDVAITQNGKAFDHKKLNARFILNGMQPPSSFKIIDTMLLAKKHFAFTSNKLEYMTGKLCTKYKKLKTKKFQGFELWSECLKRNPKAWSEMKKYNKYDVLSLEELYNKLIPWDSTIDFNLYTDDLVNTCSCGSTSFRNKGFVYSATGRYTRHRCNKCGKETKGTVNLLSRDKREFKERDYTMILNKKFKLTKQAPLPKSFIVSSTENYRIVQEFQYEGDRYVGMFDTKLDPYKIVESWKVEKKHTNLLGEESWRLYNNGGNTLYSPGFLKEMYNLKGGYVL